MNVPLYMKCGSESKLLEKCFYFWIRGPKNGDSSRTGQVEAWHSLLDGKKFQFSIYIFYFRGWFWTNVG